MHYHDAERDHRSCDTCFVQKGFCLVSAASWPTGSFLEPMQEVSDQHGQRNHDVAHALAKEFGRSQCWRVADRHWRIGKSAWPTSN